MAETQKLTSKGIATKKRIVDTALTLFAEKGFQETTLRDISQASGLSLGLTYRYFSRKEDLVLALYEQVSLATTSLPVTDGTVAERFTEVLGGCIETLAPHREGLGALFAVGLSQSSPAGVFSRESAAVRAAMRSLYHRAISGSTDSPSMAQTEQLSVIFYAAHLLTVLFWLQDKSPEQARTFQLIRLSRSLISRFRKALFLRPVAQSVAEIAEILGPMFGADEDVQAVT